MKRTADQLRRDALKIWHAGVDAVQSDRLVQNRVTVEGGRLVIADQAIDLATVGRIVAVGAGKASAGMAAGLVAALGPEVARNHQLSGWINVPADCLRPLEHIRLHAARPAGVNEPTAEGVEGSLAILRLVESLAPNDLCIALISGGGSALLPAPVEGITLTDKLAVTQHLAAAGANIRELNTVRKQLSRIKGGGLARACRAGRLITLVISDVPGDPLDIIASGPTVEDRSTPAHALAILERFGAQQAGISSGVFDLLRRAPRRPERPATQTSNFIIGNNKTAVDAAGKVAEQLGYRAELHSATAPEAAADDIGRALAENALVMRANQGPDARIPDARIPDARIPEALISGGEPVVKLADARERGLGGRNQQLVLAALERLQADGGRGIAILSGGTDGEDGPTDAAGAFVDEDVAIAAAKRKLDPADFLRRNDAYHFFEPLGALIKTGPTHTNVCDLRVVLVDRT